MTDVDAHALAVVAVREAKSRGFCESEARAFGWGAKWVAGRLPGRDEIVATLRTHNFDELLLGDIEWDGFTACCACGWRSEECKMPGDAHEAQSQHVSGNVLALVQEHVTGEGGNCGD